MTKNALTPDELARIAAVRTAMHVSVPALAANLGMSRVELNGALEGKPTEESALWLLRHWLATSEKQGQNRMIDSIDQARKNNQNEGAAMLDAMGWVKPQASQPNGKECNQ